MKAAMNNTIEREAKKAADRIQTLEAELAYYKGFHTGIHSTGTHVVVERTQISDDELAKREAANRIHELEEESRRDAMQYLADVQRLEDSISALEADLAKAISALKIADEWLRDLDMYAHPDYHLAPKLQAIRDTLAELTETDQ